MTAIATELRLSQLRALEAEAIHVMREVAAELERPVLLFSGGKDSIVLLRLAEKAFRPGRFPFPVMHVDTGHNFPEVIEFRDRRVAELGERLIVASVQDSIDNGRAVEETGPAASRNRLQTVTLLDAIASTASTPRSAAPAATRSAPARRSASSPSATRSASGSRAPSGRSCGTCSTGWSPGRARARVPALATGPSSTSGATSPRGALELPLDLLRPRARGLRARRDALRRLRARDAARRRGGDRRAWSATARSAT